MFYLPSIHRDKEGPKDDIDSLLKHINLVNIKEWGTKYIYWVQMAQSFKTAMKFSFETFFLADCTQSSELEPPVM